MEATPLPTSDTDTSVEQFDQTLATQRDRVREFLAAQQQRLQQVEAALDEQLGLLAEELARSREETHEARDDLQQRSKQLARETETFEAIKAELAVRQTQWEELQRSTSQQQEALAEQYRRQQEELDGRFDELAHQRPEIEAARTQLERDRQTFESNRQEEETRREQVTELQERLQKEQETLSAARQELLASKVDTENQRRRIAREFRSRHAAHLKELDRRQAELDALSYDLESRRSELDGLRSELDIRGSELDTHRDELDRRQKELRESELAEQSELSDQVASARKRESELTGELESLRDECGRLRKQSAQTSGDEGADFKTLARVEAERDALGNRLEEAERRLAEAPAGDVADEDVQRRYDVAMEDVRELKAKNAELQQQLEAAQAGGGASAPAASGGALDWEAEKKRILMELESDFEEGDEEGEPDEEVKAERLKIEKVVERTDRILEEKDREISELKQLLENQSSSLGSVAVGAAALGEILDSDEMVQEERENLKRLQEELAEKLRKAEVDISLERAKIGRERAELEEKLRAFEQQGGKMDEAAEGTGRSGAPVRGRWLARLGLNDSDEEKPTP